MQRFRASLSTVLLLLVAACGGGGSSHAIPAVNGNAPLPSPSAGPSALARFTLTIPAKTASSSKRAPNYISANTQSAIITLTTVNGVAFKGALAETASNLTTSNPACTGSPLTCSLSVPAAPGTDVFTVALYDQQQTSTSPTTPTGNLLSTASVAISVTAGRNNSPATPLVLSGVPATVVATFASDAATTAHVSGSVASGFSIVGNRPYTVTISTEDASGNTIVGEGSPTLSSGSSAVTLTNVTGSTYTIQAARYSSTPVSITASTPTGTAPSFTIATIPELWVTEPNVSLIAAYALFPKCSPACTSIAGDAIQTVSSPIGVAFDASSNLWTTDNSNAVVDEFPAGASPTATPSAVIGTSILQAPFGITFDASGNIWVADPGTPSVVEFPPQNNAPALQTITSGLVLPEDVGFDTNGSLWVLDKGMSELYEYNAATATPTGVQVSNPHGNDGFFTFDTASDMWLSGNTSTTGQVIEYAAPVNSSSVAAATITSGLKQPSGVAFDPAGNLWVADITAKTISGYTAANAATAFATISLSSQPYGIAILP